MKRFITLLLTIFVVNISSSQENIEIKWWNPANTQHNVIAGDEAEQIVLMIGTNNLHLNSETEIIKSLQACLCTITLTWYCLALN